MLAASYWWTFPVHVPSTLCQEGDNKVTIRYDSTLNKKRMRPSGTIPQDKNKQLKDMAKSTGVSYSKLLEMAIDQLLRDGFVVTSK